MIKICESCHKKFEARAAEVNRGNAKFCSRACLGYFSFHANREPLQPNAECAFCKRKFRCGDYRKGMSKTGLLFCSRQCKDKAQRLESGVLVPAHYGTGYSYREVAFRNLPRKCGRCGFNEHPKILQVHHKDRDKKNFQISNLEVICPNCHSLEHKS